MQLCIVEAPSLDRPKESFCNALPLSIVPLALQACAFLVFAELRSVVQPPVHHKCCPPFSRQNQFLPAKYAGYQSFSSLAAMGQQPRKEIRIRKNDLWRRILKDSTSRQRIVLVVASTIEHNTHLTHVIWGNSHRENPVCSRTSKSMFVA